MRNTLMLLSGLAAVLGLPAGAQERGLTTTSDALGGPVWQARFERDQASLLPMRGAGSLLLPVAQPQTLRLLGDYQFSTLRLGETGGLRLTGGLLINLKPSYGLNLAGYDNSSALPYAGIGYATGGQRGAWGFSADLGLAAQGLGSARLDRLLNSGSWGTDGALRLLPMIRLGMNLSF